MKKTFTVITIKLLIFVIIFGAIIFLPYHGVSAQTITSPAEINKSFTPISILPGGVSRLKVTIFNPNFFALSLGSPGWTDTLPAGVIFDPSNPDSSTTCAGGVVSTVSGVLTLSGGTVPAQAGTTPGQCSVEVNVTSTVPGNHINTIPASNLAATSAENTSILVTNTTPASATLTVGTIQAPSLSKAFAPNTIFVGATSRLTITVRNNDLSNALTETTFTDTLPANLVLATTVNPVLTGCGTGSSVTAAAGTNTITLNNGTVAKNSTCTVAVDVTSSIQGYYTNSIPAGPGTGAISTRQGVTNSSPASANLNVQNIGLLKSFSPTSIVAGAISTLTITLQNPTGTDYTGVGLTDTLPAGLIIANSPAAATTCGTSGTYTLTATPGSSSIVLSGGTIAASSAPPTVSTCTITVPVTTLPNASAATLTNTIPASSLITAQRITNPTAVSANLTIVRWLTGSKAFSPASIPAGGTATVTITLRNNRTDTPLTGVNFTDSMPANLTVSGTPTTPQCFGVISSTSDSVTLTGGTIAANSTCTITFQITASTVATYSNTIPAGDVTTAEGASNALITSNNLTTVTPGGPVTVSKSFQTSPIAPGTNVRLRIIITSPTDIGISGIAFTDTLPTGMRITNSTTAANSCGGTLTAMTGANSISLVNGTIANPSSNCTIDVYVTADESGSYSNSIPIGGITTTEGRSNTAAATATLIVSSFSMSKVFYPAAVNPNGYSTLTISLENASPAAITNVTLTDDLSSMGGTSPTDGVYIAAIPNASTTCEGGLIDYPEGTDNTLGANERKIRMTGGTIPARVGSVNGLCTIKIDVQGRGSTTTRTNTIPVVNAGGNISGMDIAPRAPATAALTIGALTIRVVKGFDPLLVYGGTDSTLSVELINPNSVVLSGITFTDNMPAGMFVANPANPNVGTCGGVITANPGESSFIFSGGVLAASSSCMLTLKATMMVNGNLTNTIPSGAVTTFNGVSSPDPTAASLTNLPGASVSKGFGDESIDEGSSSLLTITIKNINAIGLTNLGMIDTLPGVLPAGLQIAATPAPINNCGGSLTAVAGTQLIQLTGGALDANSTCTILVPVTGTTAGSYTNIIPEATITDDEGITNEEPTEDTLVIDDLQPDITVTKVGVPVSVPEVGGDVTFTYTVLNNSTEEAEITSLTDDKFGTLTGDTDCQVGTILAGGASCSFAHTFSIPAGTYPGTHNNVFTATVEDDEGNTDTDDDDETISREPNGTIIIDKVTIPGGSLEIFDFDPSWNTTNFALADGTTPVSSSLAPGSYSVSELAKTGWNLTGATCVSSIEDTETVESIELDPGETVTCTFTNTQDGLIIVEKQTLPDGDPKQFAFSGDAVGTLTDGNMFITNKAPGTYNSMEGLETGWDLTSIVCDDTDSSGNLTTRTATFELDPGESVKCTFTNTRRASLTLLKEVINDNGGTFTVDDFQANVNGEKVNWETPQSLRPATYTLSEDTVPGYSAGAWNCVINEGDPIEGENVTLSAGDSAICSIVNNDMAPSLILDKIVVNSPGGLISERNWSLTADGGASGLLTGIGAPGSTDVTSDSTFKTGTYILSEKSLRPVEYVPGSWSCVKNNGIPVEGNSIRLELGDTAICTIINTLFVKIPMTGFSTRNMTLLREQPAAMAYGTLGIDLELPILNVMTELVTVPEDETSWAVDWLGDRAGLLQGSALPGRGTSYIAAHNHLNNLEAGPFLFINELVENDRIFVRDSTGNLLIFSVYANELYEPDEFNRMQEKAAEFENSLVLITCENEAADGGYLNRRIVFARPL
ncbi:MAG: DUF11 domain-containing protein [Flexilinea flocculi]|nr:DUF11 domain-containing protein [Flexilinea flocculi]